MMNTPAPPSALDQLSRQHATLLRRTWIVVELALVSMTLLMTPLLLSPTGSIESVQTADPRTIAAAIAVGALWTLTMSALGAYHSQRFVSPGGVLVQLCVAHGGALAAVALLVAASGWPVEQMLFAPLSLALLFAERTAVMAAFRTVRRRGGQSRRVLLVGPEQSTTAARMAIGDRPQLGLRVVGSVDVRDLVQPDELLAQTRPDELIVSMTEIQTDTLANIALEAQLRGVNVRQVVDRVAGNPLRIGVGRFNGGLIVTLFSTRGRPGEVVAKRIVDVVGGSLVLVLAAPLMALAALAIAVSGGRPIYRQTRVGRFGQPFTMYKFRTMGHGADERRGELESANRMSPPVFKATNDPRVTRIGRFLRRWSIDELPQLANIIVGDMSLVGPRPARPHEVAQYETWQKRRLCVKPGLTGPWQVAGRNEVDFAEWMRLDAEYVNRWSMWRDMGILVQTVPTIIMGRGAH